MQRPDHFPSGRLVIVVTGGRDYSDAETVRIALDTVLPVAIVHGDATGADALADHYAADRGLPRYRHPVLPSEWRTLGKKAGPLRNGRMLDDATTYVAQRHGATAVLVAFPGGRGTADCVRQARAMGVPVWEVTA